MPVTGLPCAGSTRWADRGHPLWRRLRSGATAQRPKARWAVGDRGASDGAEGEGHVVPAEAERVVQGQ